MLKNNWFKILLICVTVLALFLSGCNADTSSDEPTATEAETSQEEQDTSTQEEEVVTEADPFGKYETLIDLHVVDVDDSGWVYPEGDSREDNVWSQFYRDELGINIIYDWTALNNDPSASTSFQSKVSLMIASGDIADVFRVNSMQFSQVLEAGLAADITTQWEDYASDYTKSFIGSNQTAMNGASVDGTLYAVPNSQPTIESPILLWYRPEWLEAVNMDVPETMDDVLDIIEAFVTEDPDGNGVDDTFGLGLDKDLYANGTVDLLGFFTGYHAYPTKWIEKDGEVVYGSVQPEMKDALTVLADLYSKGYLDPEFAVKDTSQYLELVANNKVGMHYAESWNNWILNDSVLANEGTMDWYPMQVVSADSDPALPAVTYPVSTFTVVSSDYEYPEALIKITNVYLKYRFEEPHEDVYAVDADGVGYAAHAATGIVAPGKSNEIKLNDFYELRDSTANQDYSIIEGSDYAGWYEPICAYLYEGQLDGNGWCMARQAGPENSSYLEMIDIYENGSYINQAFGGQTDTMVEKWSTLKSLELQVMTKIIMGEEPVSSFDDFVAQWKELGGDQILAEINGD